MGFDIILTIKLDCTNPIINLIISNIMYQEHTCLLLLLKEQCTRKVVTINALRHLWHLLFTTVSIYSYVQVTLYYVFEH